MWLQEHSAGLRQTRSSRGLGAGARGGRGIGFDRDTAALRRQEEKNMLWRAWECYFFKSSARDVVWETARMFRGRWEMQGAALRKAVLSTGSDFTVLGWATSSPGRSTSGWVTDG